MSDREKLDQLVTDIREQKSAINSFSLKINTLIDFVENVVSPPVENVVRPPLTTVNSFSHLTPSVQTSPEEGGVTNQDTSVASIDSILLDVSPGDPLNSEPMTIQLT